MALGGAMDGIATMDIRDLPDLRRRELIKAAGAAVVLGAFALAERPAAAAAFKVKIGMVYTRGDETSLLV